MFIELCCGPDAELSNSAIRAGCVAHRIAQHDDLTRRVAQCAYSPDRVQLINGACQSDRNGFTFGSDTDFPIEPMRKAVAEWRAWYEDEFDKRSRLSPRYAVLVGT